MSKIFSSKFLKISLSLFLTFCLATANFTFATKQAYADTAVGYLEKVDDAIGKTNKIIKTADTILSKIGLSSWAEVGAGLVSFGTQLSTGIGYTNMILKFLGFGGSSAATISIEQKMLEEIQDMHNQINQISAKVDQLINELSEFKSETEFNERMKEARNRDDKWKQFQDEYITNGMESLIGDYDYKIRTGIKDWCKNQDSKARNNNLDNTSIVVGYETVGEGEEAVSQLILCKDNGISDRYENTSYVLFKEAALPNEISNFSIDSYVEAIKSYTGGKIKEALDSGSGIENYIDTQNYPIFTYDGWKFASSSEKDAAVDKILADLINVLQYRISVDQVLSDDNFTKKVIQSFSNFCSYLTDSEKLNALDSLLNSIILSNTFEGEARETIQLYCASMSLKTSQYATFALDVLGKSDVTTKDPNLDTSDLNKTVSSWQKTVDIINAALNNTIKGYDDFCYITQSRLAFADVQSTIKLSWKTDSSGNKDSGDYKIEKNSVYYSGETSLIDDSNLKSYMVGETASSMISHYYNSKDPNHSQSFGQYLCQYILNSSGKQTKSNFDGVLTNFNDGLQELTDADNALPMHESYVYHDSRGLRHYPENDTTYGEINKGNFNWKKKITGDYLNAKDSKIHKNMTLNALIHSNANGNGRFLDYAYTNKEYGSGRCSLNDPRGRDYQISTRSFVTLVSNCFPPMVKAVNNNTREALGGTDSQYTPFDSYNAWLQKQNNKSATAIGSGDTITVGVLSAIGGIVIGAFIAYALFRRKNDSSKKSNK